MNNTILRMLNLYKISIMEELRKIQMMLKAPKGQLNKFGGYRYRSCEDILTAVKPLLAENECTLTITDDIIQVGDRVYVKATATLKNAKGEQETTTAFAREEEMKKGMDESQVTGASSSYARKYALNGLFCIDDTRDADALNVSDDYTNPLPSALKEVERATTADEVANIWRKYTTLQKDLTFKNAVAEKGSSFKQKAS